MRWKAILPFLMFSIFLAPANGQGPSAYFSVSTNKTFLPGEKIGIRLYAKNVEALEFRVYEVKDPIAFFERLDNPHGFGHASLREHLETPALLERFHDWKYELWVGIRDSFRMQFSARSRAGIREGRANARKARTVGRSVTEPQDLASCRVSSSGDAGIHRVPSHRLAVCRVTKIKAFHFVLTAKPNSIGPNRNGNRLQGLCLLKVAALSG
jgi:hypothetical protein